MSSSVYFMLATIIAVISILIIFKMFIDKMKRNPEKREKWLFQFFIGVAILEALPVLFVIFGFMNAAPVATMGELYVPGLVVLLAMAFALFFIFLQTTVDVTEETKDAVKMFAIIGLAMAMSIPIVSIVGLITLLPS